MKRTPLRPRRRQPRQRAAPRWSPQEWEDAEVLLQARSSLRCECCGQPLRGRVERHHRARRRDGGDRLANLVYLLPEHHAWWTDHPEEARARGLVVSAWRDPAGVAVLTGRGWVYLDDRGGSRAAPVPEGFTPGSAPT